jgi:hypothetical protein
MNIMRTQVERTRAARLIKDPGDNEQLWLIRFHLCFVLKVSTECTKSIPCFSGVVIQFQPQVAGIVQIKPGNRFF